MSGSLLLSIGLALVFAFLNGFNDSASLVATTISTGAMAPRSALLLAAAAEFIGPFLFGTAVALAIGSGIVDQTAVSPAIVFSGLVVAIGWNLLANYFGMPASSTHALVGGLVGAALMGAGADAIHSGGLARIALAMVLAPLAGLIVGFLGMSLILFLSLWLTPAVSGLIKTGQALTSIALALGHGANDGQKTMGIIAVSLVIHGVQPEFGVPAWVILVTATGNSWTDEVVLESDDNLFFNPENERYVVSITEGVDESFAIPEHSTRRHVSLAEWRKMGYDVNSAIADPKFVDAENDDFRLRPESPALELGIVPIDMGRIGIRTDESG